MQSDIEDSAAWQLPASHQQEFAPKRHPYALVIPVLNEGQRIRAQLKELSVLSQPVDIVVADGGSTDGSLEPSFLAGAAIRALITKTGPGKLSAQLRAAYAWCLRQGYAGIITVDGNRKDGLGAIADFIAKLEAGYDYVQGSRYIAGGKAVNTPLLRNLAGRLVHAPVLSLAGRRWYTDTTNGFRGYSRRYLLDPRVAPFRNVFDRYSLLFYLTARAGQLGYRTCEVPVHRKYPAAGPAPTKIRGLGGFVAMLLELLAVAVGRYHPR